MRLSEPLVVIITAYLLGSIPFGYLIVLAKQGGDVRETGSGGTGATNVSRRAGKFAGVITLALDALKGVLAIVISKALLGMSAHAQSGQINGSETISSGYTSFLYNPSWWLAAAAIAVIAGHIFPVWLKFRGGKGVATAVGVFLMLAPITTAMAGVVFIVVVALTRYVSLGSITAAVSIPLFLMLQHIFVRPIPDVAPLMTAAIVGAVLIVFAHRGNIGRLVRGQESKFR